MTMHVNLLRDGFEVVAERVKHRLLKDRHSQTLVVREDGRVRCYPRHVCEEPVDVIVGTYSRKAPIEVIENDLLCRLREITA